MRILITGFEPFRNYDLNSSWETATCFTRQSVDDIQISVRRLPVSFVRAGEMVRELLADHKPDVLLMLGQRGKGQNIDIERIAVNIMDSTKCDNDGYMPSELPIVEGGTPAYFSNMQLKVMRDAVLDAGIPAKISNSAGLYVCNSSYYYALKEISEKNLRTKAVFVHLPKISQEFSLELLADSVRVIIETIKNNR